MFPRSWFAGKDSALALALAVALVLPPLALSREARAQQAQIGPVSKLPLPRFVSLKSDRVNLHEGPSKEHRTLWVYERAGLPVEITAEFEIWRKIRNSEGVEGWVLHSLLSGRRTALVAPWKKEPLLLEVLAVREGLIARNAAGFGVFILRLVAVRGLVFFRLRGEGEPERECAGERRESDRRSFHRGVLLVDP